MKVISREREREEERERGGIFILLYRFFENTSPNTRLFSFVAFFFHLLFSTTKCILANSSHTHISFFGGGVLRLSSSV